MAAMAFVSASVIPRSALIIWSVERGRAIRKTLFVWWSSESIFLFLKQDPEVAHLASIYLKWSSLGLPAFAFNSISRRYFQSQGIFY